MKKLIVLALSLVVSTLYAQDCPLNSSPCLPGDRVIVTSGSFDKSAASISTITLTPSNGVGVTVSSYGTLDDAHEFWFLVPTDIADGAYTLKVKQIVKPATPGAVVTPSDLADSISRPDQPEKPFNHGGIAGRRLCRRSEFQPGYRDRRRIQPMERRRPG